MAPPSQLSIAASSLMRLVKEEVSYHKELQQQQSRIQKLEEGGDDADGNAEYTLRQEKKAAEETRRIFPPLRERIKEALEKVEMQLEATQQSGSESNVDEVTKAKEAIALGKRSYTEIA